MEERDAPEPFQWLVQSGRPPWAPACSARADKAQSTSAAAASMFSGLLEIILIGEFLFLEVRANM
jgi:hypothetical protein